MQDKQFVEKVFGQIFHMKHLNPIQKEIEKKIMLIAKPSIPLKKAIRKSKSTQKDMFAPMNLFISTTSSNLNISKLYKSKILPSQHLSTPNGIIKKLTRNIYFSPTRAKFPLVLPHPKRTRGKIKSVLNGSNNDDLSNISYEHLNDNCVDLLEQNKKSRAILKKNKIILKKKAFDTKKIISCVERSNNQVGYYAFHNKLREGHEFLLRKNLIHRKNSSAIDL